jgi:hypothetical protein
MCDGKERTEPEFRHIFREAGLKINKFVPLTPTLLYAIEGEKM